MERIFYFSGYRMKVFEWDDRELLGSFDFEPDDDGLASFEEFLRDSIPTTTKVLVDMIEEEFLSETIPHVNFWDRKLLIKRLVERHYREEDNVHVQVIGRNTKGRKDDQVLISALTNTGLLEPWLTRIDKYSVKVAGVWSLPLLMSRVFKAKFQGGDNTLVVTRQIRSALRNTYFRKGKLLLSRQAKFNQDIWENDTTEAFVSNLQRGTREIYNFLINQRVMENKEQLIVQCVVPESQIDEAIYLSKSDTSIEYKFTTLKQLFTHYKLGLAEEPGADVLMSYICSRESVFSDHYSTEEVTASFYGYLVDRIIRRSWEFSTLVFVTVAVLLALASIDIGEDRKRTEYQTATLTSEYDRFYSANQDELDSAAEILTSIGLIESLKDITEQTPQNFFIPLGRVLSDPIFDILQLERMEWKKYKILELQDIIRSHEAELAPTTSVYGEYTNPQDEVIQDTHSVQPLLKISGDVDRSELTYQETVERMNALSAALEAIEEVERVLVLQIPVDIRARSSFSDQVGVQDDVKLTTRNANRFELMIVLARKKHG
ncbi:MAG: hypothetical protein ACI9FB_000734 [Candidatus Azotimanducaceae bacterium]|jgi:hypothetical protein